MTEGEVVEQLVEYMSIVISGVALIFTVVSAYIVALNYFVGDAMFMARVGAFTFVGASGVKSFIDETLPGGASPVTYQITAVRSTSRGEPAQFTVKFGLGGNNITVESTSGGEAGGLQMAA